VNGEPLRAGPGPVLQVSDLRIELGNGLPVVEDVDLSLTRGRILGIVGESGSGKTTTALALLGYTRPGARLAAGSVVVGGRELTGRPEAELRQLRGTLVSYVPQDPGTALNPSMRIGVQLAEVLRAHSLSATDQEIRTALGRVLLPDDVEFARRFPHQLSGGQQQRVAIAMALVCQPSLVVMDEPTTGLDVVTQASVLAEVRRLRDQLGLAIVYVSHNLAVIAELADELAVMYAGRIVEQGPTAEVLSTPRHPYSRGLVASIPDFLERQQLRGIPGVAVGIESRPPGCAFAPRCPQRVAACEEAVPALTAIPGGRLVRCIEWQRTPPLAPVPPQPAGLQALGPAPLLEVRSLRAVHRSRVSEVVAAAGVSFSVAAGETVALVGESGSGKTTIGRCISGLHRPAAGQILLDGKVLAADASARPREARRRIQIIFQNPYDSLNPKHRVLDEIARPAQLLLGLSRTAAEGNARALLERVQLSPGIGRRFPAELSGGERQRVAIARALSAQPSLLICDEITSALDVSVQATVLEVLAQLQADLGLAVLFISHDLGVVASIAGRVLVLESGVVREHGSLDAVLGAPRHDYTRRLIGAAPRLGQPAPGGPMAAGARAADDPGAEPVR
jgi:peptide/nickel transport system ATP-binding protein